MSDIKTVLQPAVVSCPRPLPLTAAHKCEFTLNIGIFMDGSNNNKASDENKSANTNVVRLWEAYRNAPHEGFFRYYVSGVGTLFEEIDELKIPGGGGTAGEGGEARIVYALLQVINAVHSFINADEARFSKKQLSALCTDTKVPGGDAVLTPAQQALKDIGQSRGLVGDAGLRNGFIRAEAIKLTQQVQASDARPKVVSIYLDVFGFSRGAAQARVFTTWLHELMLSGGQLFGTKSYVRMLGLFDTVSSVGLTDAAASHGHNSWGQEKDLRIHKEVKSCVHYVALHERRMNFPSDSVGGPEGVIPANCSEHFCPGAHSDVGGSYSAGSQGKGVRVEAIDPRYSIASGGGARFVKDDMRKLSQLTLNEMFDAALKTSAGHESIPWIALKSLEGINAGLPERFGMPLNREGKSLVREAVAAYFALSGVPDGLGVVQALRQHGLRYLTWRYRVNQEKRFAKLPSVVRAEETDDADGFKYYLKGEDIFSKQVILLHNSRFSGDGDGDGEGVNQAGGGFSRHAAEIYQDMTKLVLKSGMEDFFDEWVHDSYAGFIAQFKSFGIVVFLAAEKERYVRWRGIYCGGNDQLNASLPNDMDPGVDQNRTA